MASAASAPGAVADPAVAARPPERPLIEPIEPGGPAEPGHTGAGETGAPALVAGASAPGAEPGARGRAESAAPALMAASVVASDGSPARGAAALAPKATQHAPRGAPGAPPVHATDARDRLVDELSRLYDDGRYGQVVALCDKGGVSGDLTRLCFLAACHGRDEAAARRLFALVPVTRREHIITNCKQFGVDLQKDDCDSDPMSCQH
jgi:hypothetical protein